MKSGSTPKLGKSTPKHYYKYASITQLVECRYRKPKVRSSSLLRSSKEVKKEKLSHIMDFGEILERPLKSNMILIILADGVMVAHTLSGGAPRYRFESYSVTS